MSDLPPPADDPAALLIRATPALLEGWTGPVLREGQPGVLVGREVSPGDCHGPWLVAPAPEWADCAGTDFAWMAMSTRTEEIQLDLARAEVRDRVCRVLASARDRGSIQYAVLRLDGMHTWRLEWETDEAGRSWYITDAPRTASHPEALAAVWRASEEGP